MRAILIAALAVAAGSASAQPVNENPPTWTIQCIDVGGQVIPPTCTVPGSRLDRREDICLCPAGGQRVEVSICAKGERPPPDNKALDRVRRQGVRDGTLVGDTIEGRRICVAARDPLGFGR